MSNFIRKAVSFNLENVHQRDLYDWVSEQSKGNFSGYVKSVLYAHKMSRSLGAPAVIPTYAEDDLSAMNDIL